MKLNFSIQLFSSLNRIGLEELASVMGGRLNYTLEYPQGFDMSAIPEASENDVDADSELETETETKTETETETETETDQDIEKLDK